jgi:sugar O-acyltransferase (sialic acid O-acetyltransferase NeuD family)
MTKTHEAEAREIIIWGAAGRGRVLRDICSLRGIKVAAVFDNRSIEPAPFPDLPFFVGREGFRQWKAGRRDVEGIGFIPAIGFEHGRDRLEIAQWLESEGLRPVTLIHPQAIVSSAARIGRGVQISIASVVDVNVTIGDYSLLGTAPVVSHDCTLGIGVHLAPGAVLAGEVEVGDFAQIGTNATVLPKIRIGASAIVGAGSVVTKDVPEGAVVLGSPARVVKEGGKS